MTTLVATSAVNVRSEPSRAGARLFVLQAGDIVSAAEQHRRWTRIATESGQGGWVYSTYLDGSVSSAAIPGTSEATVPTPPAAPQGSD